MNYFSLTLSYKKHVVKEIFLSNLSDFYTKPTPLEMGI
jgi:hypothetical protein